MLFWAELWRHTEVQVVHLSNDGMFSRNKALLIFLKLVSTSMGSLEVYFIGKISLTANAFSIWSCPWSECFATFGLMMYPASHWEGGLYSLFELAKCKNKTVEMQIFKKCEVFFLLFFFSVQNSIFGKQYWKTYPSAEGWTLSLCESLCLFISTRNYFSFLTICFCFAFYWGDEKGFMMVIEQNISWAVRERCALKCPVLEQVWSWYRLPVNVGLYLRCQYPKLSQSCCAATPCLFEVLKAHK